jgi:hypothetical protein
MSENPKVLSPDSINAISGLDAVSCKCNSCHDEEEQKKMMIHRKTLGDSNPLYFSKNVIDDSLKKPGSSLDSITRDFMESRFGYDFSQVRIHNDVDDARSAHEINALAYTVGTHIVFGQGQYSTETMEGKQLLAHELTHVIQQNKVTPKVRRVEKMNSTNLANDGRNNEIRGVSLPNMTYPSVSILPFQAHAMSSLYSHFQIQRYSWDEFVEDVGGTVEGAKETASGVWEGAKETASGVWEGAKETASGVWEGAKESQFEAWEGAQGGECAGRNGYNCNGVKCFGANGKRGVCRWGGVTYGCNCVEYDGDEPGPSGILGVSPAEAALLLAIASAGMTLGPVGAGVGIAAAAAALLFIKSRSKSEPEA